MLRTLCALLCLCALCVALCGASSGGTDEGKTLEITVVETIPAEDIEDDAVPLAVFDAPGSRSLLRSALPSAALLAAALLYVLVTVRSEKKLAALRMEAALAEARVMRLRRESKG